MKISFIAVLTLLLACQEVVTPVHIEWKEYEETAFIEANSQNNNPRLRFKRIQSEWFPRSEIVNKLSAQLAGFTEKKYEKYKPLIHERSILEIQSSIQNDSLDYETLTKWYLYRIAMFESDSATTLHSIISINPEAVEQARQCDRRRHENTHPIYGMPVLIKDNINTSGMPTTAGAVALRNNKPEDAALVRRLTSRGAIILGKVNMSEWAYFFCEGCPLGYSAMGGQTLNPYGRMVFETGGSSSGSATSVAANYAVAAVGTETAGSILSPASQNSLVGLKPTVGSIEAEGIVPLSRTLDTAGPITRSVSDNAILFDALSVMDLELPLKPIDTSVVSYKLGILKSYYSSDSLYALSVDRLHAHGMDTLLLEEPEFNFRGFLTFLNLDMRNDLASYLSESAHLPKGIKTIQDIVAFNQQDSFALMPYGQGRFDGILQDTTSTEDHARLKAELLNRGKAFFEALMTRHGIDFVVSVNNRHALQGALALYPGITVPMGYESDGEPVGLTFYTESGKEKELLEIAYTFELITQCRKAPKGFD